jgi:DNA-binding transcriptional MerR regulator
MTDEQLLTVRQLAEALNLPESTVRYYRDAFFDYIPSVGTGRRRRYPHEAVAVLRSIADNYAAGRPRHQIVAGMTGRGTTGPALALSAEKPSRAMPLEDVTNLDLLAAILDGEREQRDALWQMAKEIVRLTDVLEGQDKVLTEIADHAGVTDLPALGRPGPVAALSAPAQPASPPPGLPAPPPAPPFASPPAAAPPPPTPAPAPAPPAEARARPEPVLKDGPSGPAFAERGLQSASPAPQRDMDRLRDELESERALVERLRESKLQLEHRAADAEAALEEKHREKRPSVIRRLLGPGRG